MSVKTCEFADQESKLVMGRIVHGIMDDALREKLMRTPDLDLEKCISICRAAEIVRGQAEEMKSEATSTVGEV